jgi:chromosome segregation ATPase
MSNFTKNINILKKELKTIKNLNDVTVNQVDYKALYEESENKMREISKSVSALNSTLRQVKEEYNKLNLKTEEMKELNRDLADEVKELREYQEENYKLKDTIIELQENLIEENNKQKTNEDNSFNEMNNFEKEIKYLKSEKEDLEHGIAFWREQMENAHNQFHLERNEHEKTKLKLKNLSNWFDEKKMNYELEYEEMRNKYEELQNKIMLIIS